MFAHFILTPQSAHEHVSIAHESHNNYKCAMTMVGSAGAVGVIVVCMSAMRFSRSIQRTDTSKRILIFPSYNRTGFINL